MFLDVRPKLQTKPFGEIWVWSFCKVGMINISLVGGTRLLTYIPLSRYPKQLFQEEWNINSLRTSVTAFVTNNYPACGRASQRL